MMAATPCRLRRSALLAGALPLAIWACADRPAVQKPPVLVAHAGGIGNHRTYTNSLEALEHSVANGHALIEVDFSWTADGELVLLHDWEREFSRLFGLPPGRLSAAAFRELRSPFGITQLTLDDLGGFLEANPGITIVTDVKERRLDGLQRMADRFDPALDRIVPQVHDPAEIEAARHLGFGRLILTLYEGRLADDEVVAVATGGQVWAVTMPLRRVFESDLTARLSSRGVPVFAHTVNDRLTLAALEERGVHGVYTDWLMPNDGTVPPDRSSWRQTADEPVPIGRAVLPFVTNTLDGFEMVLECRNRSEDPAVVELRTRGPDGVRLAAERRDIPPREHQRLVVVQDPVPGLQQGWMEIDGDAGIELSVGRSYRERVGSFEPIARAAFHRFSATGSGKGVGGVLLAVVNPTSVEQRYRLRRRIGELLVDDEERTLEAGHQLVRVYRSSTRDRIEIVVSGGPMVATTLRWDPLLETVW
jgi:glycerophosphoryl diester phosphodiesterase